MNDADAAPGGLRWPDEQPVLRAPGVVLRPWVDPDAPDVLAACGDPDIQRWTTVPSPYTAADAEFFVGITEPLWRSHDGASFAIVGDGEPRISGSVGIVAVDVAARRAELGYWTAPWARGRGLATAAVRRLGDWALDVGFESVELVIDRLNETSCRVAAAAGHVLAEGPGAPGPLRPEECEGHSLFLRRSVG